MKREVRTRLWFQQAIRTCSLQVVLSSVPLMSDCFLKMHFRDLISRKTGNLERKQISLCLALSKAVALDCRGDWLVEDKCLAIIKIIIMCHYSPPSWGSQQLRDSFLYCISNHLILIGSYFREVLKHPFFKKRANDGVCDCYPWCVPFHARNHDYDVFMVFGWYSFFFYFLLEIWQ